MNISREELVRITGEQVVQQAENLPQETFEELKWEYLSLLLQQYEETYHINYFEALRSYFLGLEPQLRLVLIRHILETQDETTPLSSIHEMMQ